MTKLAARCQPRDALSMNERDFFDERVEPKRAKLHCPHCRQAEDYDINWLIRTKKKQLPRGANSEDQAKFAKAQSYMVRRDDMVSCKNMRCRKRFEVTGQSVVFGESPARGANIDDDNFGNR
jgi:hypothetical protein